MVHSPKQEKVLLDLIKRVRAACRLCHPLNHPLLCNQKLLPLLTGKHHTQVSTSKHYNNPHKDQRDHNGVYPDKLIPQRGVTSKLNI